MRLLIVSSEIPFPPTNGIRIPTWNLIKYLSKEWTVEVLAFSPPKEAQKEVCAEALSRINVGLETISSLPPANKYWKMVKFFFSSSPSFAINGFAQEHLKQIRKKVLDFDADVVVFDAVFLAMYRHAVPEGKLCVMSSNDSITLALKNELKFKIHTSLVKRVFTYLNLRRSAQFERQFYPKFDLCHFVSKVDSDFVAKIAPGTQTVTVSNGVDSDDFYSSTRVYPSPQNVLFVGSLTGGNYSYVKMFVDRVWIPLKRVFPKLSMTIVSRVIPDEFKRIMEELNIVVVSNVPNLRDLYSTHGLILSPVLKNCGILNKALEGMAASRVVIGYTVGFSGIPEAKNTVHYLGADSDEELIQIFSDVLNGQYNIETIGSQARDLVSQKYRWDQKIDQLRIAMTNKFEEKTREQKRKMVRLA